MNITENILNGETPVTEEELFFLAENHELHDLTKLDVSQVTNFSKLFMYQKTFNQPIGNWDVSNGTSFRSMFQYASAFNQPIGDWDVSNGTNFRDMFYCAKSFNQPICNWDISNCIDFRYMFERADNFKQPILAAWKLSNHQLTNANLQLSQLSQLIEANFQLSQQHSFEKIGIVNDPSQLKLLFKDNPESPFFSCFNYHAKELTLIKTGKFHGFVDENGEAHQIDTNKITIDEIIDICDIEKH